MLKKWTACGLLIFLTACGGRSLAPVEDINRAPPKTSGYHAVKSGETLYAIAWRYNRNYLELAKVNNLNSPYTLHVGQRLSLEEPKLLPQTKTVAAVSAKTTPIAKPTPASVATKQGPVWHWPTDGNIISNYSQQKGQKGIDIAGKTGQAVMSAASGEVVYSGNGLRGYGQLIIIKHNENYLSAYAHNSKLLVREGEKVKALQKIAEMGQTDTDSVRLHFEIRQQGKPVDPLQFLPKKS